MADLTHDVSQSIVALADTNTGIPPSFYGHPGYERLTFTYDAAVDALILKAAGNQAAAEKIMDYFAERLSIPLSEVLESADMNRSYGLIKLSPQDTLGLVNAFDRTSLKRQGQGQLEYLTTPGPMSFVIMAFLQVNKEKYLGDALVLGETLLAMQRPDGGISDGDRSPNRVHTEPHADATSVFYQLFEVTGDTKWKEAGDKAAAWFMAKVYQPQNGTVYQGYWENGPSTIFATDVYSWTMAGKIGDMIPLEALEAMTRTMLSHSLVQITFEVPGGETRTMVSIDFTDAKDPQVMKERGGFHPIGSPEWTGGVILALQKNAVRFQKAGDAAKAGEFKALAELLKSELMKAFYDVKGVTMVPYATGQNMAVGHGWNTPFYYVKGRSGFAGGSFIGGWGILPINGLNPFILGDDYAQTYNGIAVGASEEQKAKDYVAGVVAEKTFQETAIVKGPDAQDQIVEPGRYNSRAWAAFAGHNYKEAVRWAQKVVDEPDWVRLAQEEQKQKAHNIGGLVFYPWGTTYPNNSDPVHTAIWKYPLLNEVAAAMWILSAGNYELGNKAEAGKWMKRLVTELPYHQIADVAYDPETGKKDLIDGYWNAVISWKSNPGNSPRDAAMGRLALESGVNLETPEMVMLPKPAVQDVIKLASAITKSPAHLPQASDQIYQQTALRGLTQTQTSF